MKQIKKSEIRKDFLKKLKELERLKLPYGEYAITGSGPMAIRGLREAKDIDIVVKKALWQELLKHFTPYDSKHIKIGNVEIWGDFLNLTEHMDRAIDSSESLYGYPFVTLQDTISWKKFLNRAKDQEDIALIEEIQRLTPGFYIEKPHYFVHDLISVACYITNENKMLFLQKAEGQWSANKWGIPCGKLEENEKDLSAAMAREIAEETGIKIDKNSLKYLKNFYIVSLEGIQYIFNTFHCSIDRENPVAISAEHQAYKWVSYEEVVALNLIPFQREALAYQKKMLDAASPDFWANAFPKEGS